MPDIIVGYDGSDCARSALDTALVAAGQLDDKVVIAFGYHIQRLGGEVSDYAKAVQEHAEEVIQHGLHQAEAKGLEVESVIVEDEPAEALVALAKERDARMIVVGTHGEHPLKSAIVGSVPHKLLQISDVPVLVVPVR